jgi:hypothetical protein
MSIFSGAERPSKSEFFVRIPEVSDRSVARAARGGDRRSGGTIALGGRRVRSYSHRCRLGAPQLKPAVLAVGIIQGPIKTLDHVLFTERLAQVAYRPGPEHAFPQSLFRVSGNENHRHPKTI